MSSGRMQTDKSTDNGRDGSEYSREVITSFLWWLGLRGLFNRGYVLTSGLYFVVTAHLVAWQLVLLGTIMSLALLLTNVPAGVWADAFSRKWALAVGQLIMATAMALTGLVTAFPLLVLTQIVWGVGWAFVIGADVAWLNDELNDPVRIARVLTASARWGITGSTFGMLAFGLLAWATSLATAMIVAGIGMALLAVFVMGRFTEHHFTHTRGAQLLRGTALTIFQRGIRLARSDQDIRLVCLATLIVNAALMVAWLFPKQLLGLGFPNDPILWYTAIGMLSAVLGVLALSFVERRIDGAGAARRSFALACFVGVVGLVVLVFAPNALIGGVGVLLVNGTAATVTGPVSVVWVNRRATSEVRATVHSFLSQAQSLGEIGGGVVLAAVAQAQGTWVTLLAAATLLALTAAMVAFSRADRSQVVYLSMSNGSA